MRSISMAIAFSLMIIFSLTYGCVTTGTTPRSSLIVQRLDRPVETVIGVVKRIDSNFIILDNRREVFAIGYDLSPYVNKEISALGELYRGFYKGKQVRVLNVKEVSVAGIQ